MRDIRSAPMGLGSISSNQQVVVSLLIDKKQIQSPIDKLSIKVIIYEEEQNNNIYVVH